MAKKTKTSVMREFLKKKPKASVKAMQGRLRKAGFEDPGSTAYMHNLKSTILNPRRKRAKPKQRRGGQEILVADVMEVKQFVDRLGGIDQAREALDALQRLR